MRKSLGERTSSNDATLMTQSLSALTVVVQDYDEAIAFYVGTLGFDLLEDTRLDATKRWVRAV
jgi:hypothetical protein